MGPPPAEARQSLPMSFWSVAKNLRVGKYRCEPYQPCLFPRLCEGKARSNPPLPLSLQIRRRPTWQPLPMSFWSVANNLRVGQYRYAIPTLSLPPSLRGQSPKQTVTLSFSHRQESVRLTQLDFEQISNEPHMSRASAARGELSETPFLRDCALLPMKNTLDCH